MRRAGLDVLPIASRLARDPNAAVRVDVALSMRDQPAAASMDVLAEIARRYDGQDRSYLEALGTGATGKEAALYDRLKRDLGANDALTWSPAFARIAWRLHVPAAVPDLLKRAQAASLSMADRRLAMDSIAFTQDASASQAMLTLADAGSALKEPATWWLLSRLSSEWASYGLRPALKSAGIYDPDTIALRDIVTPKAPDNLPQLSADEIAAMTGNAVRGQATASRCQLCHVVAGGGADFGPSLDGWARGKSAAVIATAIVKPSAEIAAGYDGLEIKTKDGVTIHGLLVKDGDPLMMRSMGGVTQIIPADRVASRRRLLESMMMSGQQLGLTAQDVADVVAFLRSH